MDAHRTDPPIAPAHAPSRRGFLAGALGAGAAAAASGWARPALADERPTYAVLATWDHGLPATEAAVEVLASGGTCVDAVERGVMVSERDPAVRSVGRGGLPNADGVVELDAALMRGEDVMVGAVGGLQGILHPIRAARRVLESTEHVLLTGPGARAFARAEGLEEADLLTDEARRRWEAWRDRPGRTKPRDPNRDGEHDTIGMLALDARGEVAAATTTSGLAWKLPGRVGDSPIPGAGLYADSAVGAACATGVGEEVLRVCGSFLVVEGMRRGLEPEEAIREALRRIAANPPHGPGHYSRQVAFLALRRDGAAAALALRDGFEYATARPGRAPRLVASGVLEGE